MPPPQLDETLTDSPTSSKCMKYKLNGLSVNKDKNFNMSHQLMIVTTVCMYIIHVDDRQQLLNEEKQVNDHSYNGFGAEPIDQREASNLAA